MMSGPTRQRSFRERLHGIGISWQGKKSKSYHSKEGQTLAESETKPGFQDSRSCDPIPSCDEVSAVPAGGEQKDERGTPPPAEEPQKIDEKPLVQKDAAHVEKKLLNRSFTQPKGTEEYRVKASDTLERIAARFDTTPSEIVKLNRLAARMIFPGQMLFVPEKKSSTSGDVTSCSASFDEETKLNESEKDVASSDDDRNSQNNNKLGVSSGGESAPRRKVSVTDALRIPFRRHSDRMQRFMKVKARHFTDGQGVVAGVLIITPNAVMFDPNVSDPLVIEHGIESYGVIAPLDMVMRTAIYFDIAHMKVKNAPETPLNIPKPDIYYGKMSNTAADDGDDAAQTLNSAGEPSKTTNKPQSQSLPQEAEKRIERASSADNIAKIKAEDDQAKPVKPEPDKPSIEKEPPRESDSETEFSREGSLDKEVSDAFANGAKGPLFERESVGSPLSHQSSSDDSRQVPESRRERMLKRLSYPMESITSYTQSSLSRILSSSPKSFVDFSSGLFVRSSEEDKGKDGVAIPAVAETDEKEAQEEAEEGHELSTSFPEAEGGVQKEQKVDSSSATSQQTEEKVTAVGYKNLVDEKPELFAALDKLLKQNAAQEQEGTPLYLCLRMGHPKAKKRQLSTPILSYGKKKAKSEYWFSIPHNRVEDLYNFLQQWFSHLYGDVDDVDPDQLGFEPIDDSTEDEEEAEEQEDKEGGEKEELEGEEQKSSAPRSFLKLVEDHFGFRSISPTDWEVLSMSETDKLPYDHDFEFPVPELLAPSEILKEEHVKTLHSLLPPRTVGYPWTLLFSTSEHGFNLKSLYRKMVFDTPVLLAIQDIDGSMFGALISSPFRQSDHFYGNGESFLYTYYPEFKVFKWTGENMYFAKGDIDSIAIGSGDGQFGIWIDGDLNHGRSQKCLTFNNDVLSKKEDFIIKSLEVWGFV